MGPCSKIPAGSAGLVGKAVVVVAGQTVRVWGREPFAIVLVFGLLPFAETIVALLWQVCLNAG